MFFYCILCILYFKQPIIIFTYTCDSVVPLLCVLPLTVMTPRQQRTMAEGKEVRSSEEPGLICICCSGGEVGGATHGGAWTWIWFVYFGRDTFFGIVCACFITWSSPAGGSLIDILKKKCLLKIKLPPFVPHRFKTAQCDLTEWWFVWFSFFTNHTRGGLLQSGTPTGGILLLSNPKTNTMPLLCLWVCT